MKKIIAMLLCMLLMILLLPTVAFADNDEIIVSSIALKCTPIATGNNPSKISYTAYPSNSVTGYAFWEKNDGTGWTKMDDADVFTEGFSYKVNASNLIAKEGYCITSDTEFQLNDYFRPSENNSEFIIQKFKIQVKNGKATNKKGEEINTAWASEEITITPNNIPEGKVFFDWDITMIEKGYGAHRYINKDTGIALLTMPGTDTTMEAKYKLPLSRVDVIFENPVIGKTPSNVTYKTIPNTGTYEAFTWEKRKDAIDFYSDSYFDESEYEQIKREGFLEGYCYKVSLNREVFGDYMITDETEILFNGLEGKAPESLSAYEESLRSSTRFSYAWDQLKSDSNYDEIISKIRVSFDDIVIGKGPSKISYATTPQNSVTGEIIWEKNSGSGWGLMSEADKFEIGNLYRINACNLKAVDGYQINRLTEYYFNNAKRKDNYNPVLEQHIISVNNGTAYNNNGNEVKSAFPNDKITVEANLINNKTFWEWKFSNDDVEYVLDANKKYIVTMPDFDLAIEAVYKVPISKIEVTCIPPQLGTTPSKIEYKAEPQGTFIGDNQWWKSSDGKHFIQVKPNEIFEEGYYYAVSLERAAYIDEDYYFSDNTKVLVNGNLLVGTDLYIWNPLENNSLVASSSTYLPIKQNYEIISGEGIETVTMATGDLVILLQNGYELLEVIVNGESKGIIFTLTELRDGDVVRIISKKIDSNEEVIESIKSNTITINSKKVILKNGKQAIKVIWRNSEKINIDGYEIFRSTKRYSGFGTKAIFKTASTRYYNSLIKKERTYYYKVRGYKIVDGKKYYTDWSNKAWRKIS